MKWADFPGLPGPEFHQEWQRFLELIGPHTGYLERRFQDRLRCDARTAKALRQITPGAAARMEDRGAVGDFFEQVAYNGRRLAKLNMPPAKVNAALRMYDRLLEPLMKNAGMNAMRRQFQLSVILALNNAYYQVREAETDAFYALFHAELESTSLRQLLERLLAALCPYCGARTGALTLFDGGGGITSGQRRSLRRPRYLEPGPGEKLVLDAGLRGRCASYWSIPLLAGKALAGVMQFGFASRYKWLPRELQLLEAAAERCLMALDKARLVEDLATREAQVRQLSEHMLRVEEEERRRISRELHDEAGQSMLYIRLQTEMLEHALPEGSELRAKAAEIRGSTEHTICEVRRVIAALSPAVLEQMGLAAAVRQLVNRFRQAYPARVKVSISPKKGRLPKQTEFIAYRLAQECLNNIAKHSQASHINLRLHSTDRSVELSVEDDGVGFDVGLALEKVDSFGLSGMRERVALLGGRLEIESRPQGGSRISAELPIKEQSGPAAHGKRS